MRLRLLYLGLCVFGVVVPYVQFVPWLSQHGLQIDLFVRELFATRVGAFFGLDVVVSAIALLVFICTERKAGCRSSHLAPDYRNSRGRRLFGITIISLHAAARP
jgi:Terpene cyclase DEP1